jgi:hypothetical protein
MLKLSITMSERMHLWLRIAGFALILAAEFLHRAPRPAALATSATHTIAASARVSTTVAAVADAR